MFVMHISYTFIWYHLVSTLDHLKRSTIILNQVVFYWVKNSFMFYKLVLYKILKYNKIIKSNTITT